MLAIGVSGGKVAVRAGRGRIGGVATPILDVVTVPDFRETAAAAAAVFEARTLFFLASWLERAGPRAREGFTLHLAGIGEAPASVRRLAAQCGASLSRHEPLPLNAGSTANKLRGFDAPARSPRLLLLDSDVLVLGDLGDLPAAVPADALAASPAGNARVPDATWEAIYDGLGLPCPVERILSIRAELHLREPAPMYPYYNSGVLLLPRSAPLRDAWARDIASIGAMPLGRTAALAASDQAGLATALHRLRGAGGVAFQRLPAAYHVCPPHFEGRALPFEEVRLFHAVGFLRGLPGRDAVETEMEAYLARWPGSAADGQRAATFLRGLWTRHVRPALSDPTGS